MSEKRYANYAVMQFAKAPIKGEVKTRMAAALSEDESVDLHCALTRHSWGVINRAKLGSHELWVGSEPDHAFFKGLLNDSDCGLQQQTGAGLGVRLSDAFKRSLGGSSGSGLQGAIVVGSDCPFLDANYYRQAMDALATGADVVLGPALDGGYVLLGMKVFRPSLFNDIPWGGPGVYDETRKRISALALCCVELPALADIDEPADLRLLADNRLPQDLRRFSALQSR